MDLPRFFAQIIVAVKRFWPSKQWEMELPKKTRKTERKHPKTMKMYVKTLVRTKWY